MSRPLDPKDGAPTLAAFIREQLSNGSVPYEDLCDLATRHGYAAGTFYSTVYKLKSDGLIDKRAGHLVANDEYTGEDWL
jgi:hypothetical protein